jgi:hypothetical protein
MEIDKKDNELGIKEKLIDGFIQERGLTLTYYYNVLCLSQPIFTSRSYYISQAGFELLGSKDPPECWNCRQVPLAVLYPLFKTHLTDTAGAPFTILRS